MTWNGARFSFFIPNGRSDIFSIAFRRVFVAYKVNRPLLSPLELHTVPCFIVPREWCEGSAEVDKKQSRLNATGSQALSAHRETHSQEVSDFCSHS